MTADPWDEFKRDVLLALEDALQQLGWEPPKELEQTLSEPPDPKFGDMASTLCFELARTLHIAPAELAKKLVEAIKLKGMVARAEAVGGYVNFFVDASKLAGVVLPTIERSDVKYGYLAAGHGQKVIIEHTSVNPTKPLHIGNCRNAIIGDTVARILRALGYKVEVQNYIDDLGLQVAQTLLAWQNIQKKPRGKFDHVLGLIYVDISQRLQQEPQLEQQVRQILEQLERGNGKNTQLARRLSERCVLANLETTDRLNINYDLLVWESDIARSGMLREALDRLRKTPRVVEGTGEHAGTLILKLSDFGVEDKVLVRSDGTAVYTCLLYTSPSPRD